MAEVLALDIWVGYISVVVATVDRAEISYEETSSKLPVSGRGSESPLDVSRDTMGGASLWLAHD